MILLVTTREHPYTHHALHRLWSLDLQIVHYDAILEGPPQRATYIFTDLDRLPHWKVEKAAAFYRMARLAGCQVLTDPARFLPRFGLLRALNRAGINDFDAYRVDELVEPKRWPVFLRSEGNHEPPRSELYDNMGQLESAIEDAISSGIPKSALLIVEYCAETVSDGLYRKLSAFRIGETMLGYTCVHDNQWVVKYGQAGIATDAMYDEEYAFVRDNPYGESMRKAFDIAGIEYGRVDFGIVAGRPQVYEINSNPLLDFQTSPEAHPKRAESTDLFRELYIETMRALDRNPRAALVARPGQLARSVRHLIPRTARLLREKIGL